MAEENNDFEDGGDFADEGDFIEDQDELFNVLKESKAKQQKKLKTTKKHTRAEKKAELIFPVGKIRRKMKDMGVSKRVSEDAPVFMSAILETLAFDILELAGYACRDGQKWRILPRHIQIAITKDEELSKWLGGTTIAAGGVMPTLGMKNNA